MCLSPGGKVYTIANQDEKDLALNAGKTVKLTGDLQDLTVHRVGDIGEHEDDQDEDLTHSQLEARAALPSRARRSQIVRAKPGGVR